MPLIDDDGTDGSSFVWKIQNFSYCFHKPGEHLFSPIFTMNTYETDKWRLKLWPRGVLNTDSSDSKNTIALGLSLEKKSTSPRKVHFALSIRTTTGSFKKLNDFVSEFGEQTFYQNLLKRGELREKGSETFLDNDTMTLRCRIWQIGDKVLPSGQCYARTIIDVERISHIWPLDKFHLTMSVGEIAAKSPISSGKPPLAMKFILSGNPFSEDRIKLEINQTNKNKPCFLTCDLSLLEAGEKVVHSMREEHRFEASEVLQVWTVPYIGMSKILDCKKAYLRSELIVSSRIYNIVERVENGKVEDHQTSRSKVKKEQDHTDSLKDDLQHFYSDGVFTDLTIRTSSKDFSVHKAILCARSTVFHVMFERDMKENRRGVVDIEDIDAATVHKMLLFAYSDIVEDLDCDVASKLYFAADKYRITALRRRCSNYLKENLSVSNVCEVFVLADMHQDEDLKSFTQDFILEHAAEVIRSVEWKRFMQDTVPLASEVMHMLLLQNLSI